MDEHTKGLKRHITDAELREWSNSDLHDLAGACEVEPADPSICDACAAYLIIVERNGNEVVLPPRSLANEFVLGATDAAVDATGFDAEQRLAGVPTSMERLRAERDDLRADVGHLTMQRDHLLLERDSLNGHLANMQATIASLVDNERPCRFMPGDRVMVLLANKLEGATVTQIRIPGPIREEHVVQVELDDVVFGGLSKTMWFNHELVERLGG